jgi:hypothetical protein
MAFSPFFFAIFLATSGISKEPGTLTIWISLSLAPERTRASCAPLKSFSVIKSLNRLTTMANFFPSAFK